MMSAYERTSVAAFGYVDVKSPATSNIVDRYGVPLSGETFMIFKENIDSPEHFTTVSNVITALFYYISEKCYVNVSCYGNARCCVGHRY